LFKAFRKIEVDVDDSSRLAFVTTEAIIKLIVGLFDQAFKFLLKTMLVLTVFLF
jgi:hypothetical protein